MHLVGNDKAVMEELGIRPMVVPIRGGTDGARLSYMGLACPNICTEGENFYGRYDVHVAFFWVGDRIDIHDVIVIGLSGFTL